MPHELCRTNTWNRLRYQDFHVRRRSLFIPIEREKFEDTFAVANQSPQRIWLWYVRK